MAWSWSSVPEEQAAFLAPGLAPVTPVRTSRWPPVAMDGPMGQWTRPSPWTDRPEQALAPFLACLSAPGPHGSKLACWCPALTFQWVDRMGPPLLSWPIPPHFFHAGDARFPHGGSLLSSCSGRPSLISSNLSSPPPSFSCCRPLPSLSLVVVSSRPLFLFTPLVFVRPFATSRLKNRPTLSKLPT